ncbi:hypothetical protein V8C35DRAFT_299899 [Trichoderma chlorosporum]
MRQRQFFFFFFFLFFWACAVEKTTSMLIVEQNRVEPPQCTSSTPSSRTKALYTCTVRVHGETNTHPTVVLCVAAPVETGVSKWHATGRRRADASLVASRTQGRRRVLFAAASRVSKCHVSDGSQSGVLGLSQGSRSEEI